MKEKAGTEEGQEEGIEAQSLKEGAGTEAQSFKAKVGTKEEARNRGRAGGKHKTR